MSEAKAKAVGWKPYAILLGFAVGLGFAAFTIVYATTGLQSTAGSIGEVSAANQFQTGTWFRYDPDGYYGSDSSKVYLVANITGWAWSDDAVNGDLAIQAVLGKTVLVPTWDIRVFWYTSGMEAVELYEILDGTSGIPLWDYNARFFYAANTPSWRLDDWTKADVLSGTDSSFGLAKFYFPNWQYSFSSYDGGKTYVWDHWNSELEFAADRETNIVYKASSLISFSEVGVGAAFKLVSWSINTEMAVQTDEVWDVDTELVRVNNGALFTLNLISDRVNYWFIEIVSNDTYYLNSTTIPRYGGSEYKFSVEGYPVLVEINVRGISLLNDSIVSAWVNKSFVIGVTELKSGTLTPLTNVVISSVTNTTLDTLTIVWGAVTDANLYAVFMNDTFIGSTTATMIEYHLPTLGNATYDFKVIADSSRTDRTSSNFTTTTVYSFDYVAPPSSVSDRVMVGMTFGEHGENDVGTVFVEQPKPDATAWLWILPIAGAIISAIFIWGYLQCKKNPSSKAACKVAGVLPSKRK